MDASIDDLTLLFYRHLLKGKRNLLTLSLPFLFLIALTLFLKDAITSIILLYLILLPLSLFLGWLVKNKSKLFGLIYGILIVFCFLYGFDNWNSYIRNYNSRVNQQFPPIELVNSNNTKVKLDTIQNKIIVLDFWTTSCGVCFKKFPDFEKVYLEYKNNPNIVFYSVNIPIRRDTLSKTKQLVKELGYKFPTLFANSNKIPNSLGFNLYPHLTIIKNGRIRYNGNLVVSQKIKVYNIRSEINRLLNE
jgi:thiol-disulfide isomerase/thioredoxin